MSVFWYQVYQARLWEHLLTSRGLLRYLRILGECLLISSLQGKAWEYLLTSWDLLRYLRILGECLLISSLPGKALRTLVDIARLVEIFENTRWVSFDIKFTRQGFENACWHCEACQAIQNAFSKQSLVNLVSKDANLVFYVSVYLLFHSSN